MILIMSFRPSLWQLLLKGEPQITPIALRSAIVLVSASLGLAKLVWAQTPSPYAAEQKRVIKALSIKDVDDLMQGRGMGLAKVAELNRYPGPMHALELAESLSTRLKTL